MTQLDWGLLVKTFYEFSFFHFVPQDWDTCSTFISHKNDGLYFSLFYDLNNIICEDYYVLERKGPKCGSSIITWQRFLGRTEDNYEELQLAEQ
jgi:hypothetical protein